MGYTLEFDNQKFTVATADYNGQSIIYRAFCDIIYVKSPVSSEYQKLNIFVPEVYYEGRKIGAYDLRSAPIFLPNTVGGYMPGRPDKPGTDFRGQPNTIFHALCRGYVVVSPGVRGRGMRDGAGNFIGAAPACICDLKAAVRYLRFNADRVPGDVEKIISNGTSAGGALSSLLGTTGNHPDYRLYLEDMGAAEAPDHIFAASCYCPITNLDHADMAYEWEFGGLNDYHRMKFISQEGSDKPRIEPVDGKMTNRQIKMSEELKQLFPSYLNSLELKAPDGELLQLDEEGNGSFKDYVLTFVAASAQNELDRGNDISNLSWIAVRDGKVIGLDFDSCVRFRTRMKATPAFDGVAMDTPENELFGSAKIQYRHFTPFSQAHSEGNGLMATEETVKMLNPMYYVRDENSDKARHYRIRHGAADRDTSLAISVMLAAALQNQGVDAELNFPWGIPHAGDYDLDELFGWMDSICE